MLLRKLSAGLVMLGLALSVKSAGAAIVVFTNQAAFETALDGFTLVNLDAPPLNAFASGYHVEDAGPAAAFSSFGIDFVGGFNAEVRTGQDVQISTPGRDRLIFNGVDVLRRVYPAGSGGQILINFATPVNGIAGFSNTGGDGGHVQAFSGADGIGFLGQAAFGAPGDSFGGLTSTDLIRSARFTCERNSDLICGVYDIQFGTFAVSGAPEPASLALLGIALAGLGFSRRRYQWMRMAMRKRDTML